MAFGKRTCSFFFVDSAAHELPLSPIAKKRKLRPLASVTESSVVTRSRRRFRLRADGGRRLKLRPHLSSSSRHEHYVLSQWNTRKNIQVSQHEKTAQIGDLGLVGEFWRHSGASASTDLRALMLPKFRALESRPAVSRVRFPLPRTRATDPFVRPPEINEAAFPLCGDRCLVQTSCEPNGQPRFSSGLRAFHSRRTSDSAEFSERRAAKFFDSQRPRSMSRSDGR